MLAKIGGIPWRLNRMINDELIVGVGAFASETRKAKYVGNAFCLLMKVFSKISIVIAQMI